MVYPKEDGHSELHLSWSIQETSAPRDWLETPEFFPVPGQLQCPCQGDAINQEENVLGFPLPCAHVGAALAGRCIPNQE